MSHTWDVLELAAAIRSRQLSAREAMREFLGRVDAYDTELNSIVWRDDEAALRAADHADERLAAGDAAPFLGVPIAIKDVHAVAGQPNVKGSWSVSDVAQPLDDLFVARLRAAGFVPMGRSASPELAASTTCESDRFGVTRNPWSLAHTPAGSTGGGGAAVAAGIAPISSATDGGGSIRLPASANGLVGLKPSRGLFPQRRPNWELSSVDGVLTRTVRETAAVFDAIAHPDPLGWMPSAARDPRYSGALGDEMPRGRLGLLTRTFTGAALDAEVIPPAEAVAATLADLGWDVVDLDAEFMDHEALRLWGEVFMPAGSQLMDYIDEHRMPGWLRERIHAADAFTVRDYIRGTAELKERVRNVMESLWGRVDLVVTPTMATRVPDLAGILAEAHLPPGERTGPASRMAALTPWVNMLGCPAISIPAGLDGTGLPLGVQLVGRPFTEARLLRIAAELEPRHALADPLPPLAADR